MPKVDPVKSVCWNQQQKKLTPTTATPTPTTTTTPTTTKPLQQQQLDKSWDLQVVSNEMPPSGDIRTQTNPSTMLRCGKRKLQTPPIPTSLFSIAEDAHPILHLRSLILRAGDVEVNPRPVCRGCTETISRDITPITCSSCSQPYHRTCSDLTRNKKRTQGSICRPCAGLATATPTITQVMGTNKQCCVCNTKMRLNSIAIRCHSCGGISHRKCANVSRYAPHVDWCCHVCNHNIPTSSTTNHTILSKQPTNTMCPACRGRLANYRASLECSVCKRGFHLKCAPQTRPALEHLRNTQSWTCQTCISAPNSGTTQQSNGAPQKPRNTLRKLIVMQWNCDYLSTKIPELRVVIKKYAVDIILLQETKLGFWTLPLYWKVVMLSELTGKVVELTQEGVEASSLTSKKASNTRCPSAPQ